MKEEDEKRFVKFVDLIEREYRDLVHMKVEHELPNTTIISLIEEKKNFLKKSEEIGPRR